MSMSFFNTKKGERKMSAKYILGIITAIIGIVVALIECLYTIHETEKLLTLRRFAYAISSGFWTATAIVFMTAALA